MSCFATIPRHKRLPHSTRRPASWPYRSLITNGTPRNGPLPREACRRLFHECLDRGLLAMCYAPSFRIQPALTIDAPTVDNAVDLLADAFDAMERGGWWR